MLEIFYNFFRFFFGNLISKEKHWHPLKVYISVAVLEQVCCGIHLNMKKDKIRGFLQNYSEHLMTNAISNGISQGTHQYFVLQNFPILDGPTNLTIETEMLIILQWKQKW